MKNIIKYIIIIIAIIIFNFNVNTNLNGVDAIVTIVTQNITLLPATNAIVGPFASPSVFAQQKRLQIVAQIALNDIKEGKFIQLDPPLPDYVNLSLIVRGTQGESSTALTSVNQSLIFDNPLIFIGGQSPLDTQTIASAGCASKITVYSPACASGDFTDKQKYPCFIRGRNSESAVASTIIQLLKIMKWNKFCYIGTSGDQGMFMQLNTLALRANLNFINGIFDISSSVNIQLEASKTIQLLIDQSDCRIFYLHAQIVHVNIAIAAARSMGLLNNPKYQFIGDTEWITSLATIPGPKDYLGILAITSSLPITNKWMEWNNRIHPLNPFLEASWYDSIVYVAQAIAYLYNKSVVVNSKNLLNQISTMNFNEGVTGPFVYDLNYDRIQTFDLAQVKSLNTSEINRIALFNSTLNQFILYTTNNDGGNITMTTTAKNTILNVYDNDNMLFKWPGDLKVPTRDGITLLNGDIISVSIASGLLIFVFIFIGLISNQISMLIIEQIIYASNKKNQYAIIDIDRQKKQFYSWFVIYSILSGGVGIWGMNAIAMMNYSSSGNSILFINFNLILLIVGFFVTSITIGLSIVCAMKGFNINKDSHLSSSSNTNTNTNINTGGTSSDRYIINVGVGRSPMAIKKYYHLIIHSKYGRFIHLELLNRWFLGSAILFESANFIAIAIIQVSINSNMALNIYHLDRHYVLSSTSAIILIFISSLCIYTPLMIASFYTFSNTLYRIGAATLFQTLNFLIMLMYQDSITWIFMSVSKEKAESSTILYSGGDLYYGFIVAIFGIYILFLSINWHEMKFSRNSLNAILKNTKKQVNDLNTQINILKKEIVDLNKKIVDSLKEMQNTNVKMNMIQQLYDMLTKLIRISDPHLNYVYSTIREILLRNDDSNGAVVMTIPISLKQVLNNPISLEIFKRHVTLTFNSEIISAYLEIQELKSLLSLPNISNANVIIAYREKFIDNNSNCEINIGEPLRKNWIYQLNNLSEEIKNMEKKESGVHKNIIEEDNYTAIPILDSIENEMYQQLDKLWPDFKSKKVLQYELCTDIISYFNKILSPLPGHSHNKIFLPSSLI